MSELWKGESEAKRHRTASSFPLAATSFRFAARSSKLAQKIDLEHRLAAAMLCQSDSHCRGLLVRAAWTLDHSSLDDGVPEALLDLADGFSFLTSLADALPSSRERASLLLGLGTLLNDFAGVCPDPQRAREAAEEFLETGRADASASGLSPITSDARSLLEPPADPPARGRMLA